jgi:hypothetical protein
LVISQYNNLYLKRYPLITNPILSYPMLSFTILSYPRGRTPRSSISGFDDIDVRIFDIDVSSISNCFDIEVPRFDIEDFSISYWIDIVCYNIRLGYQSLSNFKHSISNVLTFDIELPYRTRYRRSFSNLRYQRSARFQMSGNLESLVRVGLTPSRRGAAWPTAARRRAASGAGVTRPTVSEACQVA